MAWASSEIVAVITFLLPGFVAAAVFYSLTSHPKPGDLDKIVQALVFTMVGRAAGQGIELAASVFGLETGWAAQWDLAISVAIAVTVAFFAAWDRQHRLAVCYTAKDRRDQLVVPSVGVVFGAGRKQRELCLY